MLSSLLRKLSAGRAAAGAELAHVRVDESDRATEALLADANELVRVQRLHDAYRVARSAADRDASSGPAAHLAGSLALKVGALADAERLLERACALLPESAECLLAVGYLRHAQGRVLEAAVAFTAALARRPDSLEAAVGLGTCHLDAGDLDAAESCFRGAVAHHPHAAEPWSRLGVALVGQGRRDEALAAFERAVASDATGRGPIDHAVNLAKLLSESRRNGEALALLESRLRHQPSIEGHLVYAHALFRAARYPDAFEQYEFRWACAPLNRARWPGGVPAWDGQDLRGKTIVVRAEQGSGDAIQFMRYLQPLKERGATVHLYCSGDVLPLAQCVPGIDAAFPFGPVAGAYDFQATLMSLPRGFGTTFDRVPAPVPYVRAGVEAKDRWAREVRPTATTFTIGIVWAGSASHLNDGNRSMPLAGLHASAHRAGVRLVSLQKGPASGQLLDIEADARPIDMGRKLESFADTAALVGTLDLVISVDTAVAHLAGAMGVPVWMLVATPADSRWMDEGDATPWYPDMTLFRQEGAGDWSTPLARVVATLDAVLSTPPAERAQRLRPAARSWSAAPSTTHGPLSRVRETEAGLIQFLADGSPLANAIDRHGEVLHGEVEALGRLLTRGATLLESPAGVGMHAVMASAMIGPEGSVLAVEPDPFTAALLRNNVAINEAAITSILAIRLGAPEDEPPATTIDALELARLDVLKLGRNANTVDVLRGASATLWRLRPALLVGCLDQGQRDDVAGLLAGHGYRCWTADIAYVRHANFSARPDIAPNPGDQPTLVALPEESTMVFDVPAWRPAAQTKEP